MTLDAWLIGLSSGIAVFAFVFSLLTCTLFCCRDNPNANSQEEKNDNLPEAYTEEIKRLLSRCDSAESNRLRSNFPSRNASPSLHRAGSRISRFKEPLTVPLEHSTIDEETEPHSKEMMTSSYENCRVEDETTPFTIVNCPAKVILPSPAPLHNSPKLMLPKLSVTSPSFTNLVLLEGDGESEADERTPLVREDTAQDLPIIPNLRKSEERSDNEMWEAKRRTWRGIVDAVDGCPSLEASLPSSSSSPSPLPPPSTRSISPVASVSVTTTIGGCEVGVQTRVSSPGSRPVFSLESPSNETITALRRMTRMGY